MIQSGRLKIGSLEVIMGVTAIKSVKNQASSDVRLRNYEHPSDGVTVPAFGSSDVNMWIPWCTNDADFGAHHVEIAIGDHRIYYIWQEGDFVRYSADGYYHHDAQHVPGASGVNGDRLVTILENSEFTFDLK
jgi:hypothetical protein